MFYCCRSLQPLCQKLRNELSEQAIAKQLQLNIDCPAITAYADPLLLERVLNNFLSNALRYTEKGHASLSASARAEHILITVEDSGLGIPEAEREAVFSEFHQLENPERDSKKSLGFSRAENDCCHC